MRRCVLGVLLLACHPPIGPDVPDDTDLPDDTDPPDDTDLPAPGVIVGRVRLVGSGPAVALEGLRVRLGDRVTTAAPNGQFRFEDVVGEAQLQVEPGAGLRVLPARTVSVEAGVTALVDLVAWLPEALPFEASTPVTLLPSPVGGVSAVVQVDGLVDADGSPATGPATAHVVLWDPAQPRSTPDIPGVDAAPEAPTSDDRMLSARVGLDLSITDAAGAPLQPAPDHPVTVTVTLPPERCDGTTSWPAWWLDEDAGVWRAEGEAEVAPDTCRVTLSLPHLTAWEAATATDRVTVQGHVTWADGSPAAGASVVVTGEGWTLNALTTADGSYTSWAQALHPLTVTADVWAGGWYYRSGPAAVASAVEPTTADLALEIDRDAGCDPDGAVVSDTIPLTFDASEQGVHNTWGLSLTTCARYEPKDYQPFSSTDLSLYAVHDGEAHTLRLDGPALFPEGPPAVADWGVRSMPGADFNTLTALPAGGYRHEHLGLPIDWQFGLPVTGDAGVWAVRTRAGLYAKLALTVTPTLDGFSVAARWRVQTDGTAKVDR